MAEDNVDPIARALALRAGSAVEKLGESLQSKFILLNCDVITENNVDINVEGSYLRGGMRKEFHYGRIITGPMTEVKELGVPCGEWAVVSPRIKPSAAAIDNEATHFLVARNYPADVAVATFQSGGGNYLCFVSLTIVGGVLAISVRCVNNS